MHPGTKKTARTGHLPLASMALLALLGGCEKAAETPAESAEPEITAAPGCGNGAYLRTALFGAIERQIAWSPEDLRCESMLRPDGKGVRLRFVGEAAGSQLAIILALPELQRGETSTETPAVVTLTVEGSGRFFSTPTADFCWSDIDAQEPIAESDHKYTIEGTLFCVSPLGEINGDAAISIPEMTFRGVVDWSAK